MSVRHRARTQYVEHNEEYVGEEMKPFVSFLATHENQVEKSENSPLFSDVKTMNTRVDKENKRKSRFWRKIAAFFS